MPDESVAAWLGEAYGHSHLPRMSILLSDDNVPDNVRAWAQAREAALAVWEARAPRRPMSVDPARNKVRFFDGEWLPLTIVHTVGAGVVDGSFRKGKSVFAALQEATNNDDYERCRQIADATYAFAKTVDEANSALARVLTQDMGYPPPTKKEEIDDDG